MSNLKELRIQVNKINHFFRFIVLKKIEIQITKSYKKITKYWIADETGSAFLNVHDMDESAISPGDVCIMVGAYTNLFKGMMNIHQGKNEKYHR